MHIFWQKRKLKREDGKSSKNFWGGRDINVIYPTNNEYKLRKIVVVFCYFRNLRPSEIN